MDRREFIGGVAGASGLMILNPRTAFGYEANSAVRLGLLGCGNRGTSVATSFARNTSARIVALADIFPDKLELGKAHFDQVNGDLGVPGIDAKRMFRGYKAFEEIASSPDVDAVQISTPPWFHVQHLDAVVTAGKHAYCEKPVGIDVKQAKQALEIGKRIDGKVSIDVGFQIRSAPPFVEIVRRIHEGALGKIAAIAAYYNAPASSYPDRPGTSPDELRLRNWLWDKTLSGDILLEQNIHVIDICNWVLKAHPLKASATGGRAGRPADGDVYGNYNVLFHYPDGVDVTFSSTQFSKGWWEVTERFFGTKGTSQSPYTGPLGIWGDEPWQAEGTPAKDAEQTAFSATGKFTSNLEFADREKKKAFVESIASGNFHNQADKGAESALSCMMARTAAYMGREVTWEETLKSTETWDPKIDLNKLR